MSQEAFAGQSRRCLAPDNSTHPVVQSCVGTVGASIIAKGSEISPAAFTQFPVPKFTFPLAFD